MKGHQMKTWYIVKGAVTDISAYETDCGKTPSLGDTEWQFSDAPDERGYSADFLSLEEGLMALSPAIFVMCPND